MRDYCVGEMQQKVQSIQGAFDVNYVPLVPMLNAGLNGEF